MHPPSHSQNWSFSIKVGFLLLLLQLPWDTSAGVSMPCLSNQSAALLRFKQGLSVQPLAKLTSWQNGSDCCNWEGVTCDGATGFVVGLQLRVVTFDLATGAFMVKPNPLVPSLFGLLRLRVLDLSGNHLGGPIPSRLVELRELTYLDLGSNKLTGPIPNSLAELDGLTTLNLNDNLLTGPIPSALLNLPSLKRADLSNNNLTGSLSQFTSATSLLETLDLSHNSLSGEIPSSITSLFHIEEIDLSWNYFSGVIDISPFMTLKNLSTLGLSGRNLTVVKTTPPRRSDEVAQLYFLLLPSCNISRFPEWIQDLEHLLNLDLSDNSISGLVPSWIWGVKENLNLSHNMLTGLEEPANISSPTVESVDLHSNFIGGELPLFPSTSVILDFSSNRFTSSIPSCDNIKITILGYLSISKNNITGTIPDCLCNMELMALDLSSNSLVGSIPYCLASSASWDLNALDLSKNQLSGTIPDGFGTNCSLVTLNLSGNRLSGRVPTSLSKCRDLEVLDLSNNELSGEFPSWLGGLSQLQVLSLHSNHLYGSIVPPPYDKPFPALHIIDVSFNNLSGTLQPGLFRILSGMMKREPNDYKAKSRDVEIYGDVNYRDDITVKLKGSDFQMDRMLYLWTTIDMSNNHFSGEIPNEIGILKGLVVLNMSNNDLVGPIPPSLANLAELESLDLSRNSLSGNIPMALSRLTFLSLLNLAFNNLQGQIPQGNQFATFEASCFVGNPGLCGPPLTRSCTDAAPPNISTRSRETDFAGLFMAAELGFIVGLATVVMPVFLVARVRRWFYGLTDTITALALRKLHLRSCIFFS